MGGKLWWGMELRWQVGSKSGAQLFGLCSLVSEELTEVFEEEDNGGYIPWWYYSK